MRSTYGIFEADERRHLAHHRRNPYRFRFAVCPQAAQRRACLSYASTPEVPICAAGSRPGTVVRCWRSVCRADYVCSFDYIVVMSHPVSVRFHDPRVAEQLKSEAIARSRSTSALAEELIDEGLRARRHPLVSFRDGPAGRRAYVSGGPDIWEVIEGLVGGDVAPDKRVTRAVDVFGLRREQVEAALAYYAEFTEEIDAQVDANRRAAEEAEALWRRQQVLLAG